VRLPSASLLFPAAKVLPLLVPEGGQRINPAGSLRRNPAKQQVSRRASGCVRHSRGSMLSRDGRVLVRGMFC
jgi:hypothetical protein